MFHKRSWDRFIVAAFIVAAFGIGFGGYALLYGRDGVGIGMLCFYIFVFLMGVAAFVMAILAIIFLFPHQKKLDKSVKIPCYFTVNGAPANLETMEQIQAAYAGLLPGGEMNVTFRPTYAGIVSWKFIRYKNAYITFPTLEKKNGKQVTYFTTPMWDCQTALKSFEQVYVQRKTIDKSVCNDMSIYQGTLEFFHLV